MKVLVTGASGYIGRYVVTELLNNGHEVIAVDLKNNGVDKRAYFINEDIFNGDKNTFFEFGSPDLLIHLAWKNGFIHNSSEHMLYLSKHYEFLCDMAVGGCKNIAVMGTMHEVGYWEGAIDENTPCDPLSLYGISKNALRESMLLLSNELNFNLYWLRAYYIYGDDAYANSIFSKILRAAEEGQSEFPFTGRNKKYDFITVQELARQIVVISSQQKITGIINICSGRPVSLSEQVESFIKEHGLNIKLNYGAYPDRAYDSTEVWGDNTNIISLMGEWIEQQNDKLIENIKST